MANIAQDEAKCYISMPSAFSYTVQLSTKFTKTLVSSGVPRHNSKITHGLFSNARVLQRAFKYLMHVSSARK